MIVVVPVTIPPTIPVFEPTDAIAILLLAQMPPAEGSVRLVFDPVQTLATPVIADGVRLTVTTVVVTQPVGSV